MQALRGQVLLLDHLRKQLADVAWILRKQLTRTPLIRRLKTIKGFGLILSHVLMAEIGSMERFRNHKALASYSLLAPRSRDTGQDDPDRSARGRHLGTRGNRTLKWAFIEAAHGAVRSGGRWRAMFDRVTRGGTKDRNRGYIKVARELVKVVYVVWAKGVDYQPDAAARPGLAKKNQSRSGTGQFCHPMVHAVRACADFVAPAAYITPSRNTPRFDPSAALLCLLAGRAYDRPPAPAGKESANRMTHLSRRRH